MVIPLWLVQETDAPRVLLAWLFGTNTVLAVLLQVSASRGAGTVPGALRAARISAGFFVLSCLIVLVTHDTIGWVTIALVWLGHVTVTGAELFQSAGHWGLVAELSDPDAARGVPGRRAARRHGRPGLGAGGVHVPRDQLGHAGLAAHRGGRRGRRDRHPSRRPERPSASCGPTTRATRARPACLNPRVATPAEWLAGARPRTLPAAVSPVLAGTGVAAFAVDGITGGAGGRRCSRSS